MKTYKLVFAAFSALLLTLAALAAANNTRTTSDRERTGLSNPSSESLNTGDQPQSVNTDQSASAADSKVGEQINWQVMGGGGGLTAAGGYQINGTLGQPIAGWTATTGHSVHQGYWQNFTASGGDCCQLPGNSNGDIEINVGDCIYLIYYLFRYGPPPPCLNEADINVDCEVNLADIVWLINYIFKNGAAPECGCAE